MIFLILFSIFSFSADNPALHPAWMSIDDIEANQAGRPSEVYSAESECDAGEKSKCLDVRKCPLDECKVSGLIFKDLEPDEAMKTIKVQLQAKKEEQKQFIKQFELSKKITFCNAQDTPEKRGACLEALAPELRELSE